MGRLVAFLLTFAVLFAITVGFMALTGSLPESPDSAVPSSGGAAELPTALPAGAGEEPARIVIKDISLDVGVSNPASTDVDVLDAALLNGAVRYPTTALLGEQGTLLLFGHSSYLPIVHNQNYKAFDGIQNLRPGQIISVYSASAEYRYAVTGVRQANATEDIVELPQDKQYLTLITCDSFATKSDRFVVTATLEGVHPLQ